MTEAARHLMTQDEFLLSCLDQEGRYELVDGVPVEMMNCDGATRPDGPQRRAEEHRASNRHDLIIINIIACLHSQLRGTPCHPATADIAVKTRRNSIRRPDVTVTCDPPLPDTYDAEKARMVVEVLSPSNRGIAWQRKLEEYRRRDGLSYIPLVETESIGATLLYRTSDEVAWDNLDVDGLDETINLPLIGCHLPMADLYAGINFDAR